MKNYKTVVSEGLEWMAEDFEVDGNIYFNWEDAVANCPEGWRIPTIEEWRAAHVKRMRLNRNGCIYEKGDTYCHLGRLGRQYYWTSSPYISHDGGAGERLGMGIYIKGGRELNKCSFLKKGLYPIRYVRGFAADIIITG